jgi:hypothetical protein
MARPLFIFGIARGGTNLIARALGEHGQVAMALDILMPVFRLWRNLACLAGLAADEKRRFDPSAPFQDYYFHPDGAAQLQALFGATGELRVGAAELAALREAVVARAELEHPGFASTLARLDGATIGAVFTSILEIIGTQSGKAALAYIGFKEVWTIDFLPALACLFPEARFIVIHRDPRAVVTSLLAMARKDPTQKAHPISYLRHWRKQVVLAQAFAADRNYSPRLSVVRFEDLCDRPGLELARLCDVLGIDVAAEMLRPGGDWPGNSSFGPRQAHIDAKAAERWRATIAPALLETVDFHCGREMRMIGYAPDHESGALTQGIVETVRDFDADPGKWRSDACDWQTGLAWECLRHSVSRSGEQALPADIQQKCFLRVWNTK